MASTSGSNGTEPAALDETKTSSLAAQDKKPSKLKQLWAKIDLDVPTFLIMVKGSIPPIIALAMYQSDAVANYFSTQGYLVAIMSILGFCIMPRGKFIQNMLLNILGVCVGAALNLLALFCVTQARQHTTPAGVPPTGYNSSASAVAAVWLMFQLYLVNCLRGAKPQFNLPCIVYSIFTTVSMTYGVLFPNMTYAESFMTKLLIAFLAGFGLATGVSFLILPTSSRMVVFKQMTGYMSGFKGVLQAQTEYMKTLEEIDPVAVREAQEAETNQKRHHGKPAPTTDGLSTTPAALKLKGALAKVVALHTKLNGDITSAKREFAFGKLESHDLTEIWRLERSLFIPIYGLTSILDILHRRAAEQDWAHSGDSEEERLTKQKQLDRLHFLMKEMRRPFASMTAEISRGIDHFLLTLELVKPPKKKGDEESQAGCDPSPGSPGFLEHYRSRVQNFHATREKTLSNWCRDHGVELPPDFFADTFVRPEHMAQEHVKARDQRSLFLTLYLEYLLWRTSSAVLDLITYAEKRKQEGALKRNKLIFPGSQTLYKWVRSTFGNEDLPQDDELVKDLGASRSDSLYLGQDFGKRKDPEHLPPRNTLEKIGDVIRKFPAFLRSDTSAFGFRVALATMSIAIICFLQASQQWFLTNRILWAMIMVAISMTRTAGQSAFTFALRIIGTIVAMAGSYIVWYIVDGKTPGIFVFLWVWITAAFYIVVKQPQLIIVALLGMVTTVLIVGYELQVRKIGIQASESNGQPAYEAYLLAPIRLGTVVGGLCVAYIWTIFPYPVSESSEIRRDLGAALYLTANFYSIVHEIVNSRVRGTDADGHIKGTHGYKLEKARYTVLIKLMGIIQTLEMNTSFSKFQLRVGGRFPREEYEILIATLKRIVQYMAMIGYASRTLSVTHDMNAEQSRWSRDFHKLLASVAPTSHQTTSILSLLSSSITNAQPLPPYLEIPKHHDQVKRLEDIDPDILSIRHIAEPEYSAFAVIKICAFNVGQDIELLCKHVKNLTGVIDFTYHAIRTESDDSVDSSSTDETVEKIAKHD